MPLTISSTPLGVAFDRSGELLAVGTGSGSILLFGKAGKLLWKRTFAPCYLPEQISFSSDNHYLLIRAGGSGVLRTDGSVVWTGACSGVVHADGPVVWTGTFGGAPWTIGMNASHDMRTFVTWEGYPHSPNTGQVRNLDESGKQLWSKFSEDPAAVVTPAGDKIVARVNVNQDLQETQEPLEMKLQVFSRAGALLKDLSNVDGKPMAISPDGERVLIMTQAEIEGIDLNGTRLFAIALNPTVYRSVLVAEDFSGVLVLSVLSRDTDSQLRWYKLK